MPRSITRRHHKVQGNKGKAHVESWAQDELVFIRTILMLCKYLSRATHSIPDSFLTQNGLWFDLRFIRLGQIRCVQYAFRQTVWDCLIATLMEPHSLFRSALTYYHAHLSTKIFSIFIHLLMWAERIFEGTYKDIAQP